MILKCVVIENGCVFILIYNLSMNCIKAIAKIIKRSFLNPWKSTF